MADGQTCELEMSLVQLRVLKLCVVICILKICSFCYGNVL